MAYRAYHWGMSNIYPQYLDSERSKCSLAVDLLFRKEPEVDDDDDDDDDEEEEDNDGQENDDEEEDEEEDDDGYSE